MDVGGYASDHDRVIVSVQWDIGLHTCTTGAFLDNTRYRCALSDPLFCSGIKSDFWVSYYHNSWWSLLSLDGIAFEDETLTKYTFNNTLCRKNAPGNGNFANPPWNVHGVLNTQCPEPALAARDYLLVTEVIIANIRPAVPLVAWFPPITMFNYPNNGSNTEVVKVSNGVDICDLINSWKEILVVIVLVMLYMYIYRYYTNRLGT